MTSGLKLWAVFILSALSVATLAVLVYALLRDSDAPEAEAWVGPEGGNLTVRNPNSPLNGVRIEVPKGALTTRKKISISSARLAAKGRSNAPAPLLLQGIELGPKGTTFAKPAIVHVPYLDRDRNGVVDNQAAPVQFIQFVTLDPRNGALLPLETRIDRQNLVISTPILIIPARGVFVIQPRPFEAGLVVRYAIRSLPGGVRREDVRVALGNAFNSWLLVAKDVKLSFEETAGAADIEIRSGSGSPFALREALFNFAGYPAYTTFAWPGNQRTIWLREGVSFGPPGGFDLESVMLHEIGHALGLGHRDDCEGGPPVMCPGTPNVKTAVRELALEDMNDFLALYGLEPRRPAAAPPLVRGSWLSPQPEAGVQGIVHSIAYFPVPPDATGVSRVDFLVWRDSNWSLGCSQPTPQAAGPGISSFECDVSLGGVPDGRIGMCFNIFYRSGEVQNCAGGERFVNKVTPREEPPTAAPSVQRPPNTPVPPPAARLPSTATPVRISAPPNTPVPAPTQAPQAAASARVWTDRPSYAIGSSGNICWNVSQAGRVVITDTDPTGATSTTLDQTVGAGQSCGQVNFLPPAGTDVLTIRLYDGGREIASGRATYQITGQQQTLPAAPQASRLGGLPNLDGYCRAKHGANWNATSSSGQNWFCAPPPSATLTTFSTTTVVPINFDDACKWTYPSASNPWGRYEGGGWVCYTGPR